MSQESQNNSVRGEGLFGRERTTPSLDSLIAMNDSVRILGQSCRVISKSNWTSRVSCTMRRRTDIIVRKVTRCRLKRRHLSELEKVKTEWRWAATAFNIIKLVRAIGRIGDGDEPPDSFDLPHPAAQGNISVLIVSDPMLHLHQRALRKECLGGVLSPASAKPTAKSKKLMVYLIQVELLRIEVVAHPFQGFVMLVVFWVLELFKEVGA